MFIIRPFHKSDLPGMVALVQDLGYEANDDILKKRFESFGQKNDYQTIVADHNGVLAGMMALIKLYGWEQDYPILKIQDLVVKKDFQRQGIGKMLIAEARKIAKNIGANQIVLNSGNRLERAAAHKFYPKMGFEITSTFYKLKL